MNFYAVIYGPSCNDILYFPDFNTAKLYLILQTVGEYKFEDGVISLISFKPIIKEYIKSNNQFQQTIDKWSVNMKKLEAILKTHDYELILTNPYIALHTVEHSIVSI